MNQRPAAPASRGGPDRQTARAGRRLHGGVPSEARLFAVLFLAIIASGLAVIVAGVYVLSGIRAYVNGEGLYSKAQKGAVQALHRYGDSGSETEWADYRRAVAVPLADERARRLLSQQPPDVEAARRALVEGGNDPADVAVMARLFLLSEHIPEMRRAVWHWEAAGPLVEEIVAVAERLRAEVRAGRPDPAAVATLLADLERIDRALTVHEMSFSAAMGASARRVERWLLAGAGVVALLLLGVAIASSNRLLARMQAREVRFRSIIENASDVVTIVNRDVTIRYASPSTERVLGWKPEMLEGTSALDRIHPDDHAEVVEAVAQLMAHPGDVLDAEFRFRHRDGDWRTLRATGSSYEDETGEHRLVVNSRDITEQRRLEGRLAQAGRLESVGRLAGGVAHDFNNLLTAILGAAEAARDELPEGSPARQDLADIVAATGRAAHLTRQLLAFASRQMVEPEVFDLGGVVCELESMLRRLLDESIELTLEAGDQPTPVRADRAQIEQVILNLAVNARDAMPAGGRLAIRLGVATLDEDAAARETGGEPGPFVRLEVEDTGHAMPPEVLERVFEPFFSTKQPGRGTGLGLATSYGIVKQSRGHIAVTSEPGRGTCFRVFLPLSAPVEPARAAAPRAARSRGHEVILLVEDQAEVRRVAAKGLRARGFAVLEAGDGQEALSVVRDHLPGLDLLVTDVVMPRMSGPALADRLRQWRPGLPVIFISGYTGDEVLPDGGGERTAVVAKPFSADALGAAVRRLLDAGGASGRPASRA